MCSLCYEPFLEGQKIRTLPTCIHFFHRECIDRWLLEGQAHQQRRCPLCNANPVETVVITCPPNVGSGDRIRVHHHDACFDVTIPFGVSEGQVFHTNLPRASFTREAPTPGQSERSAAEEAPAAADAPVAVAGDGGGAGSSEEAAAADVEVELQQLNAEDAPIAPAAASSSPPPSPPSPPSSSPGWWNA